MPPTKKRPIDDVTAIKSQLAQAEDERLVKSWFSPGALHTDRDTSAHDEGEDQDDFEDELGGDDEGGLGYVAPQTGLAESRQSHAANEKLRKQLLGVSPVAGSKARVLGKPLPGLQASKPKPQYKKAPADSDDDTEGRTAHAARRISRSAPSKQLNQPASDRPKKRSANYLDEILAQRQFKKKKGQKT